MNINQPLYWHQGLFLQPQHFQLNDACIENRLARTTELIQPYPWGLISLKVNESALTARQCLLDQVSVRFPEGTLAEFPGNAVVESRNLNPGEFSGGARTLYVGLRRMLPGDANAQVFESLSEGTTAQARFAVAADPDVVADRFGDSAEARVRGMSYILRLFWDDELEHLSTYELLPVARFEQDGDRIRLVTRYVPPCVNLAASPMLMQTLREIRDELVGRARQLAVFKQPGQGHRGDLDATQVNYLMALAVLNRNGPLLTHLLETPQVSPWQLYGVLRQLIGELSLFSDRCDMLGETPDGRSLVLAYRHEEAGASVAGMAVLIGQQLNEISVGSELLVRLTRADGLFRAALPEGFFGPRHRYYLIARSECDPVWLSESLPRDGKLGAPAVMHDLISRALPGVELIYLQVPPQGLPRLANALYFRLETLSDGWENLQQDREAALFLPQIPDDLLIELVVVRA
ncbi:type VI secretion system baseplate subunit TssK [Pseudomonas sp. NPDC086278]|uniref:type VI secretion system baseplate subunit TssK n=1 Tax=Pseudomonas sp. NPDC086278 TaxID=3390646 RepID=UPI003D05142C